MTAHDSVNLPKHYISHPSGIEVYEITRHLNFAIGSAFKYVARFDKKWNAVEDLRKAVWYLTAAVKDKQEFPDMSFMCGDYATLRSKLSGYEYHEPNDRIAGVISLFHIVIKQDTIENSSKTMEALHHLITSLEHMIHALQVSD